MVANRITIATFIISLKIYYCIINSVYLTVFFVVVYLLYIGKVSKIASIIALPLVVAGTVHADFGSKILGQNASRIARMC